jgi:hypothetical protein
MRWIQEFSIAASTVRALDSDCNTRNVSEVTLEVEVEEEKRREEKRREEKRREEKRRRREEIEGKRKKILPRYESSKYGLIDPSEIPAMKSRGDTDVTP